MTPAHANCEVYRLLKDGVKVTARSPQVGERVNTIHVCLSPKTVSHCPTTCSPGLLMV